MSPSVDVTIELDSLNIGKVNVVKNKTLSFTGKAINVAIGVARLGSEAYATGFMYNEKQLFRIAVGKNDMINAATSTPHPLNFFVSITIPP